MENLNVEPVWGLGMESEILVFLIPKPQIEVITSINDIICLKVLGFALYIEPLLHQRLWP